MRLFRSSTEVPVTYTDLLREMFPDLDPEVDDLFLLESHQIAALPERVSAPDLAAVLHAHPRLRRFLVARHPKIEGFLVRILAEHDPVGARELTACEQALVWESAAWIAYQRAPQSYDTAAKVDWDLAATRSAAISIAVGVAYLLIVENLLGPV